MRGWLFGLVPWMVTAAVGLTGLRPAEVNYTHLGIVSEGVYRDGNDCWIRPEVAQQLGWKVRVDRREADIKAESRRLRVPVRTESGGEPLISLTAALQQLGGVANWDLSNRLSVTGELRRLEIKGSNIEIDSTLEAWVKQSRFIRPDRLVLEFVGISVPSDVRLVAPPGIKAISGPDGRTVLIEIQRPGIASFPLPAIAPSRSFNVFFDGLVLDAPVPVTPPVAVKTPEVKTTPTPEVTPEDEPPVDVTPAGPDTVAVNRPRVSTVAPGRYTVSFPINRRPTLAPTARYDEPDTIVLKIPNARWAAADGSLPKSEFLTGMKVSNAQGTLTVTLQTNRVMGFRLTTTGSEILLAFSLPKVRGGTLAGRVIVVDPGHGGVDSGAVSVDKKVKEKDVVLAISRLVATELTNQGAAAIMTRDEDVRIPLKDRADLANRNSADIFISIHVNSNKINNSRSGTMIFHHLKGETGRLLATCIAHEIEQVSGLPCMGPRSDGSIYRSGFSVLRNSTMPGVLCELGFINHESDRRRMVTDEFQRAVAKAIVKGIKVFLGDAKPSPSKK
jgi:N-acetylmuramoyl-L-alanine amidase